MKVKVTKKIMRDGNYFMGLSIRQAIGIVVSILIAIVTIILLIGKMSIDSLMTIVFFEIAITMALGIVQIQGVSILRMVIMSLKSADKRPYSIKGVFNSDSEK